jgi:alkaline phosphatase
LTPPSELFSAAQADLIISRFFVSQKFDLQATVRTDPDTTITSFEFKVDGKPVEPSPDTTSIVPATVDAAGSVVSVRGYQNYRPGVHTLTVTATQSDGQTASATGNFEVVSYHYADPTARDVIIMLGDDMGSGHRTAARLMQLASRRAR